MFATPLFTYFMYAFRSTDRCKISLERYGKFFPNKYIILWKNGHQNSTKRQNDSHRFRELSSVKTEFSSAMKVSAGATWADKTAYFLQKQRYRQEGRRVVPLTQPHHKSTDPPRPKTALTCFMTLAPRQTMRMKTGGVGVGTGDHAPAPIFVILNHLPYGVDRIEMT